MWQKKPVRKCLSCGAGFYITFPKRTKVIEPTLWSRMDARWAEEFGAGDSSAPSDGEPNARVVDDDADAASEEEWSERDVELEDDDDEASSESRSERKTTRGRHATLGESLLLEDPHHKLRLEVTPLEVVHNVDLKDVWPEDGCRFFAVRIKVRNRTRRSTDRIWGAIDAEIRDDEDVYHEPEPVSHPPISMTSNVSTLEKALLDGSSSSCRSVSALARSATKQGRPDR
jgi:hypothetical protein